MKRFGIFWCVIVVAGLILSPGLTCAKQVIGISHLWLGNDWNIYLNKGITKTLESMGYEVLLFNAQGDTAKQVGGMENFITRKVDGAIIAGGEARAFREVSLAYEKAGIPLVAVDMVLPGGVAFTATNNWEGGAKMGMFIVNECHGNGKVLLLNLPSWDTIRQRGEAALMVLKEFPGVSVVSEQEVGVHEPVETAYSITKATIRAHSDLRGVIATWGLPGIGAAKAVMDMGLQAQVAVATCDSDRPIVELMADPKAPKFMTYGQDSHTLGVLASELLDKALKIGDVKKAKETLPVLSFGPTLFIGNTGQEQASVVKIWTPDQAWENLYSDQKKPW